jgi:4'-phosphopantetheinyl transferase
MQDGVRRGSWQRPPDEVAPIRRRSEGTAWIVEPPVREPSLGEGPDAWWRTPSTPDLGPDDVHLWRAGLAESPARLAHLAVVLDDEERRRAEGFFTAQLRNRFLAGRGILREVLAGYVALRPEQVRFRYGPNGKPELARGQGSDSLRFNLSHTADHLVIAVCYGRSVGVDIESVDRSAVLADLSERILSGRERAWLVGQDGSDQPTAIVRLWARKEALVKGVGLGLGLPIRSIDALGACGPTGLTEVTRVRSYHAEWSLRDFDPAPGLVGALALESGRPKVTTWTFSPHLG